jgi:hypothetical protein
VITSDLGDRAGIPTAAAIAVELVNGLGVVSVRVSIAGDVGPGGPGRSPAGGQADQLGVAVGRGGGPVPAPIGVAMGMESIAPGGLRRRHRRPAGCRPSERPGRRAVPLER